MAALVSVAALLRARLAAHALLQLPDRRFLWAPDDGQVHGAAQPSRAYIDRSPCHDLEPLDREHPRTRVLSDNEIRTLWHGLDRDDLPWVRRTRLAIKFALVSMLCSGELAADPPL
jgi:hypothetical protein